MIQLPNSPIENITCFDKRRDLFLDVQLDVEVPQPQKLIIIYRLGICYVRVSVNSLGTHPNNLAWGRTETLRHNVREPEIRSKLIKKELFV